MSRSVANPVVRHARTLPRQAVSFLTQPALNAEAPQKYPSSLWKARAIIAVIALQREKQKLNYNIFLFLKTYKIFASVRGEPTKLTAFLRREDSAAMMLNNGCPTKIFINSSRFLRREDSAAMMLNNGCPTKIFINSSRFLRREDSVAMILNNGCPTKIFINSSRFLRREDSAAIMINNSCPTKIFINSSRFLRREDSAAIND